MDRADTVDGGERPGAKKRKAGRLGERPAFLLSPPGCGISKPWGVWEGASMNGLGSRWRAS